MIVPECYRYPLLILFAMLFTAPAYGQEPEDGIEDYVAPIEAANNIRTGLSTKNYRLRFFTNSDKILDFNNRGVNALVGARFGKFNLMLSLPLAQAGNLLGTDARQLAINLDIYQPWGFLQLSGQRISGFQEDDLVAGIELRRNTYRNGSGGEDLLRYRFSPRLRGRLALGYNGQQYFASVRASTLPGFEVGTQLNARIRNTRIALVLGRRLLGKKKG